MKCGLYGTKYGIFRAFLWECFSSKSRILFHLYSYTWQAVLAGSDNTKSRIRIWQSYTRKLSPILVTGKLVL